jgi:hypothetical protein
MIDFYSLDLFGSPFKHVETYFEYDGVRTFAMRSTRADIVYIGNCVDEDDDGNLTFLFSAMSHESFLAVRSGQVPFRDAFITDRAALGLHAVTWRFAAGQSTVSISNLDTQEPPAQWLPQPGVRLDLKTETVPGYDPDELSRMSQAQRRTVFAIEVESGSNITEFPTKQSGQLQVAVQSHLEALAREISADGVSDMQTSVVDLRAASFVIVLAVDSRGALFENTTLVESVFETLSTLLGQAGASNLPELLTTLKSHSKRVRNSFKEVLTPLVRTESGIAIDGSVASGAKLSRVEVSPKSVRLALAAIEDAPIETRTITLPRAVLTGLNLRTRRFEVFDPAEAKAYKGPFDEEAMGQVDGLSVSSSKFVHATIREEKAFAADDSQDNPDVRYILVGIEERTSGAD